MGSSRGPREEVGWDGCLQAPVLGQEVGADIPTAPILIFTVSCLLRPIAAVAPGWQLGGLRQVLVSPAAVGGWSPGGAAGVVPCGGWVGASCSCLHVMFSTSVRLALQHEENTNTKSYSLVQKPVNLMKK